MDHQTGFPVLKAKVRDNQNLTGKEVGSLPDPDQRLAVVESQLGLRPRIMTEKELSELSAYPWMPSRIPVRDALVSFVPDAPQLDPVIAKMQSRLGQSAWFPVPGGHRVLMPYDGGEYDTGRFTIEPGAWDHEHCNVCQEHIPGMTLCYVTKPGQPYVLLCSTCYERYVTSDLRAA